MNFEEENTRNQASEDAVRLFSTSFLLYLHCIFEVTSRFRSQQFDDDDESFQDSSRPANKGRDLRPTVGQLRVAEMVRRILQRAVLTGQFDGSTLDLREVGFDIEDVHMSKDMSKATVFWNATEVLSFAYVRWVSSYSVLQSSNLILFGPIATGGNQGWRNSGNCPTVPTDFNTCSRNIASTSTYSLAYLSPRGHGDR